MSASGSTMKTFQKRLYHALPRAVPTASSSSSPSPISRVRSNSASSPRSLYTASGPSSPLSFFESGGAPAASRPHVARLESRVEIELHSNAHTHGTNQQSPHNSATQGGNPGGGPPPWSLALTTPNSNPSSSPHSGTAHHSVSFFPYAPFTAIPTYNPLISPNPELRPHPKRQRTRYHLDVGAYGIAKRRSRTRNDGSRPSSLSAGTSSEDLHLASAVGEDAYFVRENAMGVADGVGGWSRVRGTPLAPPTITPTLIHIAPDSESSRNTSSESTASALFARRLMHYCSAELDSPRTRTADLPGPFCEPAPPPPTRTFTRAKSPLSQPTAFARPLPQGRQSTYYAPISQVDELYEEFEDSLEELEEGLDVLMILEKAYERTLKAHVEPVQPSTPSAADTGSVRSLPPTSPLSGWTPQSLDPALDVDALAARISPALTLSSSAERSATGEQYKPLLSGSSTALVAILDYSPTVSDGRNPAPASVADSKETASSPCVESGAVLRIANLGDSMGMLVRGEEIVWRSEEMWTGVRDSCNLLRPEADVGTLHSLTRHCSWDPGRQRGRPMPS